jgi:hypothetical protein
LSVAVTNAQAPAYSEVKPLWDETDREQYQQFRTRETLVRNILNGRAGLEGDNGKDFDEYFRRQVFAKMTLLSELGKIAERRQDFFKSSFQMANPPAPVHDRLVQLTFSTMQAIAINARFHPYVRYNAMLMIGELNEVESTGFGGNRRPPVPLPAAVNFMLTQLNDPKQIDEVRMAALVGMLRHAQIGRLGQQMNVSGGGTPQERQANLQRILAAASQVAEEKDPPAGRSIEGHTWMRRRAIDIFMVLGASTPQVASVLEEIVADTTAPVSLRCTAAEAIGKMPTSGGQQGFDATKTAQDLAAIAIEVCQAELDWWKTEKEREQEKKSRTTAMGGAGMYGMGGSSYPGYGAGESEVAGGSSGSSYAEGYGAGYPGSGGYPGSSGAGAPEKKKPKVDTKVEKTQRRLKHTFYCVKLALDGSSDFSAPAAKTASKRGESQPAAGTTEGGMLARANAQQKAKVKELATAVSEMFRVVDVAEPKRDAMLTDLQTQLEKLQGLTAAAQAGPPASGAPGGSGPSSAGPGSRPSGPGSAVSVPSSAPANGPAPAKTAPAAKAPPAAGNNGAAPGANAPNSAPATKPPGA